MKVNQTLRSTLSGGIEHEQHKQNLNNFSDNHSAIYPDILAANQKRPRHKKSMRKKVRK